MATARRNGTRRKPYGLQSRIVSPAMSWPWSTAIWFASEKLRDSWLKERRGMFEWRKVERE